MGYVHKKCHTSPCSGSLAVVFTVKATPMLSFYNIK